MKLKLNTVYAVKLLPLCIVTRFKLPRPVKIIDSLHLICHQLRYFEVGKLTIPLQSGDIHRVIFDERLLLVF